MKESNKVHVVGGFVLVLVLIMAILFGSRGIAQNHLFVATNTVDQTILYTKEFNNRQKCTTVMATAIDIAGEVKAPLSFECIEL